jgi:ATP-dependent DNA ligase
MAGPCPASPNLGPAADLSEGHAKRQFEPRIPTRGTAVPAHPDWIHEVKQDGYRLAGRTFSRLLAT